jgi:hypothetical protein
VYIAFTIFRKRYDVAQYIGLTGRIMCGCGAWCHPVSNRDVVINKNWRKEVKLNFTQAVSVLTVKTVGVFASV